MSHQGVGRWCALRPFYLPPVALSLERRVRRLLESDGFTSSHRHGWFTSVWPRTLAFVVGTAEVHLCAGCTRDQHNRA
jgi:hypothetical protein